MKSETVIATPTAIALGATHGIDLGTITGTGKDGRILKSDVEAVLAAKVTAGDPNYSPSPQADPTPEVPAPAEDAPAPDEVSAPEETPSPEEAPEEAEKVAEKEVAEEVTTTTVTEAPVEVISEPVRKVGDRMALMFLSRRTGLPITSGAVVMDSDPLHLVDTIVPVVGIRSGRKDEGRAREVFNPVIPDSIFTDLMGSTKTDDDTVHGHKIGFFIFDGMARDRLRYVGYADEVGKASSVRQSRFDAAARNWSLSLLANPDFSPGGYRLNGDVFGAQLSPRSGGGSSKKALTRPQLQSLALGAPDLESLAMERYSGQDQVFGQSLHPLANSNLTRLFESSEKVTRFRKPSVTAVYTELDTDMMFRASKDSEANLYRYMEEGKILTSSFRAGNWKDWILGKFVVGLHAPNPELLHKMIQYLTEADRMFATSASKEAMQKARQAAAKVLMSMIGEHVERQLNPRLIAAATRRESRSGGFEITPKVLDMLVTDGSSTSFRMAHAEIIAKGQHPKQAQIRREVVRACSSAWKWHIEALEDIRSAISGMTSYYCSRTEGGSVGAFVTKVDDINEVRDGIVSRLAGVRPSFFVMSAPPVQIVDSSCGVYVPNNLLELFA